MYVNSKELTLTDEEIERAARLFLSGEELCFQSRMNRDAVSQWLKQNEHAPHRRTSIANQIIDPRYTFEGREMPDKGLANYSICCNLYELVRK